MNLTVRRLVYTVLKKQKLVWNIKVKQNIYNIAFSRFSIKSRILKKSFSTISSLRFCGICFQKQNIVGTECLAKSVNLSDFSFFTFSVIMLPIIMTK